MSALTVEEVDVLAQSARAPTEPLPRSLPDLLFRGALLEHTIPGLSWRGFVRLTQEVLLQTNGDAEVWARVAFARDVGRRHLGERALLEWPVVSSWFAALDNNAQSRALAHAVQSAADADLEAVEGYAASAEAWLDRVPVTAEALSLRGAVGRGYAALGEYGKAGVALERAVAGWFELGRVGDASHPLCELLRVRGIQRDAGAVTVLRNRVGAFLEATPDPTSRAFVELALGRALVQSGAGDDGQTALRDTATDWGQAPPHVQASRLRWLHYVAVTSADDAAASEHLAKLDDLRDEGQPYDSDQRYVARVDRGLAQGSVLTPDVEALVGLLPGGDEAARTLVRLSGGRPLADAMRDRAVVRRMAWEYRY